MNHPAWVKPYTKSTYERLAAMLDAVLSVNENLIRGDIVECGVWRGGNIMLARRFAPDRVCWLYDTFAGMTKPQAVDVTSSGRPAEDSYRVKTEAGRRWAAASVEEVRGFLEETDTLDDSKLRFVIGDVEQTLLDAKNLPDQIAVLRLDTDWYASTRVELEVLYPLLMPGGVLIVDDYGHWAGCKKAVDDYFGKDMPPMTWIDYTAIQIVKP
jgi:O-methyltransferase